ncbi:MAG: mannitol operon transcriptional activator [Verrucomicrobiota bacterium]|jgi:mannitol operon transcriptional antiterminator|nr:mannitol operon transcriptional activator [Verrucomicrobiota bacterium]
MKDRQKKMLRFLLTSDGVLRIDDVATVFSISKRTVSRDLDVIGNWLERRGAVLERKPNQGIRIRTFNREPLEFLDILNTPESYLETLPPPVRHQLILLYLIFQNREVKISEIANVFFISDTTVWNDLNQIEADLRNLPCTLERFKGVGLYLKGEETFLRLKFLQILTELFSCRAIIPYLYFSVEDKVDTLEVNQFQLLMEKIRFPVNRRSVMKRIAQIYEILGYRFTMSGEALLYFYLQLSSHRIKSGALIKRKNLPRCHNRFLTISTSLLTELVERTFSGQIPQGEKDFLGLLLQVLEIGDISASRIQEYQEIITPPVADFVSAMISQLGEIDNELYYLDKNLQQFLNLAVASLVTRLQNGIPSWHGDWGNSSAESWNRAKKERAVNQLLDEYFNLRATPKDLEYLLIHFQSLVLNRKKLPEHKIRCLVCCFEGIGLASYLQSILKREFPQLEVVEATAVYKINQTYLESNRIDLILSTFPVCIQTPVIQISLPLDRDRLKKDISNAILKIRERSADQINPAASRPTSTEIAPIPFDTIWNFILGFSLFCCPRTDSIEEVIQFLAGRLTKTAESKIRLEEDLKNRERLGSLFFEEFGTRVIHCKSTVLKQPRAGAIQFEGECQARILFLVAPDPCPDPIRLILSEITVSFIENRYFRQAIMSGTLSQIRKNLMNIYKELL